MRPHGNNRWFLTKVLCLALVVAVVGVVRAENSSGPFVVAAKDAAIWPGDAATLRRLVVRQGRRPWLIYLARAWFVTPPSRRCEIYLRPEVREERLRRGEFLRGGDFYPGSRGKMHWEVDARCHAYAQVPLPGQRFDPGDTRPGTLDGPFSVTGTISNPDLVAVVDLIRTKEPPENLSQRNKSRVEKGRDGEEEVVLSVLTIRSPVDGTLAISGLEAKDADHVYVTTTTGDGSGQDISVQREIGRWKIVAVGQWNA